MRHRARATGGGRAQAGLAGTRLELPGAAGRVSARRHRPARAANDNRPPPLVRVLRGWPLAVLSVLAIAALSLLVFGVPA